MNWTTNFNLSVNLNRLEEKIILFTIIDNNTVIYDNLLEFKFANNYKIFSCSNLPPDDISFIQECVQQRIQELTPQSKINEIPGFTIKVGGLFFYDVNATGKNISFEDFSYLFDIDKRTGVIYFVPTTEQIGQHQIFIRAFDIYKNEDFESFSINITK